MSNVGTNIEGRSKDTVRYLSFAQEVVNPQTSDPQRNPFGNIVRIFFPSPQSFKNAEIALANLYIFYSWFNITAIFGNNVFSYAFPTASGYMTFNVTIPDGFYSIDSLNQIFEQIQRTNGTYLIDTNGNPVYFIYWVTNETFYRVSLFSNPVPANGVGYTVPANYPGGGVPTTDMDPSLIILPTNAAAGASNPLGTSYSFSKILGFSPGSYPSQAVADTGIAQSYNGQYPPVIESTTCVQVACSLANSSSISANAQTIYTFSPTVTFGSQIVVQPHFPLWVPVSDGFYNYVDITFLDSSSRLLNMQDPNLSGSLIIRGK